MTLFGWLLIALLGVMAATAWSNRNDTDMPKNNMAAMFLLIAIIVGVLLFGTGSLT